MAVAEDLPVEGVYFVLQNDLAGGRVLEPTPTGSENSMELRASVLTSVEGGTQPQTGGVTFGVAGSRDSVRRASWSPEEGNSNEFGATRGILRTASGSLQIECSGDIVWMSTRAPAGGEAGTEVRVLAPTSVKVVIQSHTGRGCCWKSWCCPHRVGSP